jgi:hypothetical protein
MSIHDRRYTAEYWDHERDLRASTTACLIA